MTPILMICGGGVSFAAAEPFPVLSGLLTAICFFVPFASLAVFAINYTDPADEPINIARTATRESRVRRLAIVVDQAVPKWVGVWAEAGNSRLVFLWWIGSLIIFGGIAGAVSITQLQPWPSIVAAVVGGNLAFITALNGKPLLSPVLRSSSIGYVAVWRALIRLPTILSLVWFAIAALPAVVVSRHLGGESAGAVPLLILLNILCCAAVALSPSSRRQAVLLYACFLGVIIYQWLHYGITYGVLAVIVMLGVVALLWRQARKRFRSSE